MNSIIKQGPFMDYHVLQGLQSAYQYESYPQLILKFAPSMLIGTGSITIYKARGLLANSWPTNPNQYMKSIRPLVLF